MEPAAERWARMRDLLYAALDLDAVLRAEFLDRECAGDPAMRAEIDALIDASEQPAWIDEPILGGRLRDRSLKPGQTFHHYTVVEEIGRGGMGVVYRAVDNRFGRPVALKVMLTLMGSEADRQRFLREARAVAALNHPGIVTVYEFDTFEGVDYMASEFVDGRPLSELLDSTETVALLGYAQQAARALAHAHGAGIVHRDLKPANIMVTAGGEVKLLDFGVARRNEPIRSEDITRTRLTVTGMQIGTPSYMSPEQVLGQEVDHRADIFAFGVLLYRIVTGREAFLRPTAQQTCLAVLQHDPDIPPNVSGRLAGLIRQCLQKNREQRPESMSKASAELRRILADSRPDGPSRKALLISVAALGFLGLLGWRAAVLLRPAPRPVLTYSLEVQRMRDGQPLGDPYPATEAEPFEPNWRFRIRATAARRGYLYVTADNHTMHPPVNGTSLLAGTVTTRWCEFGSYRRILLVFSEDPQPVPDLTGFESQTTARAVSGGTELSTAGKVAVHRIDVHYGSTAK